MELSATEKNQGGKGVDRRELQKNELFSSSLRSVKTLTIVIFFFFLRFYFYQYFTLEMPRMLPCVFPERSCRMLWHFQGCLAQLLHLN